MYYAKPLERLIGELEKIPGVGVKSAQRYAFYILRISRDEARQLAEAILDVKEQIGHCAICFNFTDEEVCEICRSDRRDRGLLCVVGAPHDVIALEKTHEYRGVYHILGGVLDPQAGIGPDMLRLRELARRISEGTIQEVIVALNPTTEGETTALYIKRQLGPFGVKLSQIAFGLPVGGDLDYADQATLVRALEGRRPL